MFKFKSLIVGAGIVLVCALIPPLVVSSDRNPQRRDFLIKARQYAYDPPRIIINKGDEVHIRLASLDVIHGFYLEGHDIDAQIEPGKLKIKMRHPSKEKEFQEVDEIVFTANRSGKFRYRCSHTCGTLHPFMQGELIVGPNYSYLAAMGGAGGVLIAAFVLSFLGITNRNPNQKQEGL